MQQIKFTRIVQVNLVPTRYVQRLLSIDAVARVSFNAETTTSKQTLNSFLHRAGFRRKQGLVETGSSVYSDHQRLDARSLAMHCLVAKKLNANPSLIFRARSVLARHMEHAAEPVPSCFLEWERILQRSKEEIAAFLESKSEDATRLRQSSPFTNILTPQERANIYNEFTAAALNPSVSQI